LIILNYIMQNLQRYSFSNYTHAHILSGKEAFSGILIHGEDGSRMVRTKFFP
jgi:hypothetical protein